MKKLLWTVVLGILFSSFGSAQASSFSPGSSSVCTSNDGTVINELYIYPNGKRLSWGGFISRNLSSSSKMYHATGIWNPDNGQSYSWTFVFNRRSGQYSMNVDAPVSDPTTIGSCEE